MCGRKLGKEGRRPLAAPQFFPTNSVAPREPHPGPACRRPSIDLLCRSEFAGGCGGRRAAAQRGAGVAALNLVDPQLETLGEKPFHARRQSDGRAHRHLLRAPITPIGRSVVRPRVEGRSVRRSYRLTGTEPESYIPQSKHSPQFRQREGGWSLVSIVAALANIQIGNSS
jgi:hypothetical protein